ncbi:hypothetical protein DZA29_13945 [Citrobacter gillenii]|nr:hypothetical protein DZA29_13945 [Citrobacter gillenii]
MPKTAHIQTTIPRIPPWLNNATFAQCTTGVLTRLASSIRMVIGKKHDKVFILRCYYLWLIEK